jgi:hypothetical protein
MKKIISMFSVLCVPILFGMGNINAQTSFNVFTYKEPTGYSKEAKTDVTTYPKSDNKKNTYCVIGLYAASNAAATPQQTFTQEWKELVEKTLGAKNPQTENAADINGWKTITGTSAFEFNGGQSAVMQFCFVKGNQTASIVALTNSTDYEPDITVLLDNLKLKNAGITNATTTNSKPTVNNKNDLRGEWYLSDGNAKITLLFGANGRYDKGAMVDGRIVSNLYETTTIKGKGTYSVSGSTLTLIPTTGSKEVYQIRFSTDTDSEGKPKRILHLKRPVAGGQMYESDYYFVPQKEDTKKTTATTVNPTNSFALLNGDGITGVWISYANINGGLGNLSWNWRVFFSDKKSLSNLPNGGFANLKYKTYFDNSKNDADFFNVGIYNFANGKGTNTKSGSNYTDKLELIKPTQLKIDGTVYMKCTSINGQKLNGTFTTYANPQDPDLLSQPKGNRSVISFTTDGKFIDEGVYQTLLQDYGKGEAYNAPGKGTYELKDYSIILKFYDGRVKQEAFTVPNSRTVTETNLILISRGLLTKMK